MLKSADSILYLGPATLTTSLNRAVSVALSTERPDSNTLQSLSAFILDDEIINQYESYLYDDNNQSYSDFFLKIMLIADKVARKTYNKILTRMFLQMLVNFQKKIFLQFKQFLLQIMQIPKKSAPYLQYVVNLIVIVKFILEVLSDNLLTARKFFAKSKYSFEIIY